VRIHELARELGVPSKDILASLDEMGYEGRTASSTVPEEAVPRLRAAGGRVRPGIKPRTATEDLLPRRRPTEGGDGQADAPTAVAELEVEAPAAEPELPATPEEPAPEAQAEAPGLAVVRVARGASPQDLAEKLGVTPAEIVKTLLMAGEMVTVTQSLTDEAIEEAARLAYPLAKPVDNTDFALRWRKEMTRRFVRDALREVRPA